MINVSVSDKKKLTDIYLVVEQPGFEEIIIEAKSQLDSSTAKQMDQLEKYINELVENLRQKLNLPHTFKNVIHACLLDNEVTDDDYSPALLEEEVNFNEENPSIPISKSYILISQFSRNDDVIAELQKYHNRNRAKYKYPDFEYPSLYRDNATEPLTRFLKHRSWYLKDKAGKSPKEIDKEKEEENQDTSISEENIRKGIKNYPIVMQKFKTF